MTQLNAPPPEKSAGGFQQAGKKEGGWGEGIFARPRFPPPPNFVFRFAKCAADLHFLIFGVALK